MARQVVLLFDTRKDATQAARLHASTCKVVSSHGPHVKAAAGLESSDAMQQEIAELESNGWPVKRCKCLS